MAYEDFKDLTRRTASDKILRDKAFNIAKNPKYDEYQKGLASMVYIFFDENSTLLRDKSPTGGAVEIENMSKQELAVELHKLIIRKFKKRRVYSYFIGNNWGANDTDMQLITKFNKGITKLKILCHRHMSIVILTLRTFLDCFSKKSCQKQIKKSLGLKK